MALVIGLTGSIASGKSTVSSMFAKFRIPVIDADKIAREVVMPGESAYKQIVEAFGEKVLFANHTLDRKKLGSIIFADEKKREKLNGIVHPAVREKMLSKRDAYMESGERCIILDIPLLFESNLTHFVDKTIVVAVDEDVQLTRLMERDGSSEREAKQRIDSQIPIHKKVSLADAIIDNNGTVEESFLQLEKILKNWGAIS
ncbi:dephospho-CoA kinase [Virgibacillus siamensis]|uniref:dephospho-CoA kinase n=1 Tax=Virgibacillus siamensis TaxID=480071 RepID=UPI000985B0E0|nr:dephospho-CoA kinase [Virgibacillus siamensis]